MLSFSIINNAEQIQKLEYGPESNCRASPLGRGGSFTQAHSQEPAEHYLAMISTAWGKTKNNQYLNTDSTSMDNISIYGP